MSDALQEVIRAFQRDVQSALALFRDHRGVEDLVDWRSQDLLGSGCLDPDGKHEYSFHGSGCRVRLSRDKHIDWDFGPGGRTDGFDLWRLENFLRQRPKLQRLLPLSDLKPALEEAIASEAVVSPWRAEHDHLYYLASDVVPDAV